VRYAVIIERGPSSYGAYVPDLPGCVAVAESLEELRPLIRQAIEYHVEELIAVGAPVPEPTSLCEYIEAPPAA
jgi:predicted RNase H-like HicB family nuclease